MNVGASASDCLIPSHGNRILTNPLIQESSKRRETILQWMFLIGIHDFNTWQTVEPCHKMKNWHVVKGSKDCLYSRGVSRAEFLHWWGKLQCNIVRLGIRRIQSEIWRIWHIGYTIVFVWGDAWYPLWVFANDSIAVRFCAVLQVCVLSFIFLSIRNKRPFCIHTLPCTYVLAVVAICYGTALVSE